MNSLPKGRESLESVSSVALGQACPNCFEYFTKEGIRTPLLLTSFCGHTACAQCVDDFAKKNIQNCPECRVLFDDNKKAKPNFTAINLLGQSDHAQEQNKALTASLSRVQDELKERILDNSQLHNQILTLKGQLADSNSVRARLTQQVKILGTQADSLKQQLAEKNVKNPRFSESKKPNQASSSSAGAQGKSQAPSSSPLPTALPNVTRRKNQQAVPASNAPSASLSAPQQTSFEQFLDHFGIPQDPSAGSSGALNKQ